MAIDVMNDIEDLLVALGDRPERDHGPSNSVTNLRAVLWRLAECKNVDQDSFGAAVRAIGRLTDVARMIDRIAEFRAADWILLRLQQEDYRDVRIRFGEAPDLRLSLSPSTGELGIEVKRCRQRMNDNIDDAYMNDGEWDGDLVEYGNPKQVQKYLDSKVLEPAERCMERGSWRQDWVLFIISDSLHYVEDLDVRAAVVGRYVGKSHRPNGLRGIVLKDRGACACPTLLHWNELGLSEEIARLLQTAFVVEHLS